jgi:AraC-like DNA-binding protein
MPHEDDLDERVPSGALDVLEHAAASCATLGDAARCAARCLPLAHAGMELRLVVARELAALYLAFAEGLAPVPATVDALFACLLSAARRFTGKELRPLAVDLVRAAPDDRRAHERDFGPRLRFGASIDALWFPADALALPLLRADASLHRVLLRYADDLLRSLPRPRLASLRVREELAAELCDGDPTAERVAVRLGMSTRSLHRALQQEGTTFRRLADDLRCGLALRHLEGDAHPVDRIAPLLGFSHASSFQQAFRRWTGESPAQYRSRCRDGCAAR